MKWEIVNPSDSFVAVSCAAVFIGEGQYALTPLDNDSEMPLFLFGGCDEWFIKTFDKTLSDCIGENMEEIIKALRSVNLPNERTSLNDIKGYALQVADGLQKKLESEGEQSEKGTKVH